MKILKELFLPRGLFMIFSYSILCVFLSILASFFVDSVWNCVLSAVVITLIVMSKTIEHFIVSVPEVTALLTVNYFNGMFRQYNTGLHFCFPWEVTKRENFISLKIESISIDEDSPSKDGSNMKVKGSFQYQPDPGDMDGNNSLLSTYITVSKDTIVKGSKEAVMTILATEISRRKADTCRMSIGKIASQLSAIFTTPGAPHEIETKYGIKIVRVTLADIDYDDPLQAAKSSKRAMRELREAAKELTDPVTGNPSIQPKDAMNLVMIEHGKIRKTVTEVEGEGLNALGGLLVSAFKKDDDDKKGGKK